MPVASRPTTTQPGRVMGGTPPAREEVARSGRREQILDSAAELFATRGFHGVSVADLGAAVGISGPALYKHFTSKDAVLAEMLESHSEQLLVEGRRRVAAAAGPTEALASLVDWHVDFALRNRPVIVVQDRDWASLPAASRERVRATQLAYVDLWAGQLALLGQEDTHAMAHAAFGLLNSTPHSGRLPDERMRSLLRHMALGALGLGE